MFYWEVINEYYSQRRNPSNPWNWSWCPWWIVWQWCWWFGWRWWWHKWERPLSNAEGRSFLCAVNHDGSYSWTSTFIITTRTSGQCFLECGTNLLKERFNMYHLDMYQICSNNSHGEYLKYFRQFHKKNFLEEISICSFTSNDNFQESFN